MIGVYKVSHKKCSLAFLALTGVFFEFKPRLHGQLFILMGVRNHSDQSEDDLRMLK